MAKVYSLVAWGGLTGKTVTLTIANPCVVSSTYHGLRDGAGVVFVANGDTLPTGLTAGVTYYSRSTGTGTINLYDTSAHAIAGGTTGRVITTGSQAGTHILQGAYRYGLTTGEKARYGSPGSERIYDGLTTWRAGRAAALFNDEEICEIGEGFTDNTAASSTTAASTNIPAGSVLITTLVNGVRSAGYHHGLFNAGFIVTNRPTTDTSTLYVTGKNHTVDGFTVLGGVASYYASGLSVYSLATARNMICLGGFNHSQGTGMSLGGTYSLAENCISVNWATGVNLPNYVVGPTLLNCTVTKNNTGVSANNYQPCQTYVYNNIVVGNVTLNLAAGVYGFLGATNNAGLTGEPWTTAGGTAVVIAVTDFLANGTAGTYAATDDFSPAASTSPQVEAAADIYGAVAYDIADAVRPNYMNGAAAYRDIGAFEFDHGYGPWPATHTLTLTNVVVGSQILIRDQANTTTHYLDVAASSTVVLPITVYSSALDDWVIKVRKASGSPTYIPWETLMTATAGTSSIYVSQIPDE